MNFLRSLTEYPRNLQDMSSSTRSCVICVGSTGAGKSATIQRCTKQSVPSGNGHDRVTNKCSRYDLTAEAKADLEAWAITQEVIDLTWVDTVGWDDADQQGKSSEYECCYNSPCIVNSFQMTKHSKIFSNLFPTINFCKSKPSFGT